MLVDYKVTEGDSIPGIFLKPRAVATFLLLSLGLAVKGTEIATEPDRIVEEYCTATQGQQGALSGSSMEVEISASLPKMKKNGRLHGLRRISRLGRITYEHIVFEGDGTIKNQVIARYLAAEVEAQKQQTPSVAVTPANYKFSFKAKATLEGRPTYVFNVSPRGKRVGLFKGQVWIDAATYLPVMESGYWVKSPSVFLKKVAFLRKFEIRDGISVPLQTASTVDTRIWGPAELEIDFSNFSVDPESSFSAGLDDGQ
ncbi:MAG: hypothetical protein JO323_18980 [Acidobacteriia bacterium]|nr:hypothetical protein [Terriglobia bacterium]